MRVLTAHCFLYFWCWFLFIIWCRAGTCLARNNLALHHHIIITLSTEFLAGWRRLSLFVLQLVADLLFLLLSSLFVLLVILKHVLLDLVQREGFLLATHLLLEQVVLTLHLGNIPVAIPRAKHVYHLFHLVPEFLVLLLLQWDILLSRECFYLLP